MNTPAEVLARHQWRVDLRGCVCDDDGLIGSDHEMAQHQLEAVAAAGLVVLPKAAVVDPEDLWDAQQYVQDWRDSDTCDDTPAHRKRLNDLVRRLRDASNAASIAAEAVNA